MNIFYLSKIPEEAAEMHCDKHVVKMILETAQLLSTAHRVLDGNEWAEYVGLYKATHKNHPSSVWVRSSNDHYKWTLDLLFYLCKNYTLRYGKIHKTMRLLDSLGVVPEYIEDDGFTQPPQCMPDEYKRNCSVRAYRAYYNGEKAHFAQWNHSETPEWWTGVPSEAQ